MSEPTRGSTPGPAPLSLPDSPSLQWLRKAAKDRLRALRNSDPEAKLADAQLELARGHGFSSWRALKAHVDSLTVEGQVVAAAREGDVAKLAALLDRHPRALLARDKPYGWTPLHVAARHGRVEAVGLLLGRGLEANAREDGDNTYPMHWAAAAGHLAVVRRLADAGGDVVGRGDDHELEVIGWATCFGSCHDAVADFLVGRGARHHVFSAIAMGRADEVRQIVAEDPSALNRRMSRNENHQTPLHFAVRKKLPAMVALLLELGADPLAVDGSGHTAAAYATAPDVDRAVMEKVREMTAAELTSARRGHRSPRVGPADLLAALALGDWTLAERLVREDPRLLDPAGGVLHLMAKRGDLPAVKWLLARGANPNELWAHWDSELAPLHLAILGDHTEVARQLLDAGADPAVRDSKHQSDATGWAEHFGRPEVVEMLRARRT